MVRIAVTGHMDVSADSEPLIRERIDTTLDAIAAQRGPIIGISCIARGADSIFADAILDRADTLEVVLPSADYRATKVKESELGRFDKLVAAAATVRAMPFVTAGREAYEAANAALLDDADILIAIWDGNTSQRGGTGTVVAEARAAGVPVVVIWPEGARRADA
jgi:hypothetical protein